MQLSRRWTPKLPDDQSTSPGYVIHWDFLFDVAQFVKFLEIVGC
jgi:hypothetical protein